MYGEESAKSDWLAAVLGSVPVKVRQRLPAGRAYISHFFPPRIRPQIATGLRQSARRFIVPSDGGKISVEQLLTVITPHIRKYTPGFGLAQSTKVISFDGVVLQRPKALGVVYGPAAVPDIA